MVTKRSTVLLASAALMMAGIIGCGGSTDGNSSATGGTSSGGEPTGGATTGGGPSSGGSGGSQTAGSCPASPPATGDPCVVPWEATGGIFSGTPVAHCTWGDDPRLACRTQASCVDGAWQVSEADCGPLLPAGCPAVPPTSGSDCSDTSTQCWYDSGTRCACSDCQGGSAYPICMTVDPPQWACVDQVAAGCPYPLPQVGSPCEPLDVGCGLSCDSPFGCVDGVWQWTSCPECCPICASPDTPIATPAGDRPIAELRPGDLVYSVEGDATVVVPVVRVAHTRVVAHRVLRVTLDDGAVIEMSPGHPTSDGRPLDALRVGDRLDETHLVVRIDLVPFLHDATYDILPASTTGSYYAAGALVGSTLR